MLPPKRFIQQTFGSNIPVIGYVSFLKGEVVLTSLLDCVGVPDDEEYRKKYFKKHVPDTRIWLCKKCNFCAKNYFFPL